MSFPLRLKENAKQDSEKVKSLSVDLQRKEEDSSDLREKLADYKKQMQQVQKEVHALLDVSVCRSHSSLLMQFTAAHQLLPAEFLQFFPNLVYII